MRRALTAAVIALMTVAGIAQAQTSEPEPVTYEGHELVFDAADGPVQFLVVETVVKTATNLDGQTTSSTVRLAEFRSDGDRFVLVADDLRYPKAGALATADLGDTFALSEVGGE